jgi:ornithine cyclodeaminase
MDVLVLSKTDIARLLPMHRCIDVMEEALKDLSAGRAAMPLRTILPIPGTGEAALGFMPAMMEAAGVFGAKVTAVFPSNLGTPYESHQGVVLLFEGEFGRPLAVLDAGEITAVRTAAVSGVATRVLARDSSRVLTLVGSGGQAAPHLEAMVVARPSIDEVRVWSREADLGLAEGFVARESERWAESRPDLHVELVPDLPTALAGADVVCTLTAAAVPVVRGEWLSPGTHVNAVGFSGPTGRELDAEALRRSAFFVDRRESIENEGGEYLAAVAEGAIGSGHVRGELGEVLLGTVSGRTEPEEITMFRSLGLAVEDVASARFLYDEARVAGVGTWAPLGGTRGE